MMKTFKTTLVSCVSLFILTSCLQEPKEKAERIYQGDEYEKVLDEVIGIGSINPSLMTAGQRDTRVETLNVSNSFVREINRRRITLVSVNCSQKDPVTQACRAGEYVFNSEYYEHDNNGNVQGPTTFSRKTTFTINQDGYYEFMDDGNEKTLHSWDYVIGLRGFCHSFETQKYQVEISCSDISLKAGVWNSPSIPTLSVKVLSLIRYFKITDKTTGETQSNKLRYTVKYAPEVQEISKIVSYCSEGLQQFENQIYYLVRCNNLESL